MKALDPYERRVFEVMCAHIAHAGIPEEKLSIPHTKRILAHQAKRQVDAFLEVVRPPKRADD